MLLTAIQLFRVMIDITEGLYWKPGFPAKTLATKFSQNQNCAKNTAPLGCKELRKNVAYREKIFILGRKENCSKKKVRRKRFPPVSFENSHGWTMRNKFRGNSKGIKYDLSNVMLTSCVRFGIGY